MDSEKKETFVFRNKWYRAIKSAPEAIQAKLTTALLEYAVEGIMPEDEEIILALSFIKEDIDEDKLRYEKTCAARAQAGKRGGRPKGHHAANEHVSADNTDAQNTEKQKKQKKQKNPEYDYEYDYDITCENTSDNIEYLPPLAPLSKGLKNNSRQEKKRQYESFRKTVYERLKEDSEKMNNLTKMMPATEDTIWGRRENEVKVHTANFPTIEGALSALGEDGVLNWLYACIIHLNDHSNKSKKFEINQICDLAIYIWNNCKSMKMSQLLLFFYLLRFPDERVNRIKWNDKLSSDIFTDALGHFVRYCNTK